MASTSLIAPLLTVEEFLRIRFASDQKAELSNGVIRMMAGGKGSHARVKRNILRFLGVALRGSGCSPYDSDMGVRTGDLSIRYPDVSVFCGRDTPENDSLVAFDDPRAVIEVLSPSTRQEDLGVKLEEYRTLGSIETIVFVEPESGLMRLLQRTGDATWTDADLAIGADLPLLGLSVSIPNTEIFSRD